MFIIDTLIGNPDRNNKNWGLIRHPNKNKELAPVYDNGNCLNNKWNDNKMSLYLKSDDLMNDAAINDRTCVFTLHNKRINPCHFIKNKKNAMCNKSLLHIGEKIKIAMPEIISFIDSIPEYINNVKAESQIQKTFFKAIIIKRFNDVICNTYNELNGNKKIDINQNEETIKTRHSFSR